MTNNSLLPIPVSAVDKLERLFAQLLSEDGRDVLPDLVQWAHDHGAALIEELREPVGFERRS